MPFFSSHALHLARPLQLAMNFKNSLQSCRLTFDGECRILRFVVADSRLFVEAVECEQLVVVRRRFQLFEAFGCFFECLQSCDRNACNKNRIFTVILVAATCASFRLNSARNATLINVNTYCSGYNCYYQPPSLHSSFVARARCCIIGGGGGVLRQLIVSAPLQNALFTRICEF